MKKLLALLAGISLLSFSTVYAEEPQGGGPAGPAAQQEAGIGKEVNKEAKTEAKQNVKKKAHKKHKKHKKAHKKHKRGLKRIHQQSEQAVQENATTQ